jgi:FAD dependent oxidoreductase
MRETEGETCTLPPSSLLTPLLLPRPHVAEDIFNQFLAQRNITVQFGQRLASASKSGTVATSITMESGLVVEGTVFIDASYEGIYYLPSFLRDFKMLNSLFFIIILFVV